MKDSPRALAAHDLIRVLDEGAFASLLIKQRLREFDWNDVDKRFYTALLYTTLDKLPSTDAAINAVSKTKVAKMKPYVAAVLRTAVTQLRFMDKVPEAAAVHEAVELIKNSPYRNLSGFVNAVLRACIRNEFAYAEPVDAAEKLSLRYNMPKTLTKSFLDDYGEPLAKRILEGFQEEKPLVVRANLLKTSVEELGNTLGLPILNRELGLLSGGNATELVQSEAYQNGLFHFQDEAGVLAATLAGAKSGMRVLDLCAAPGGKSMIMAQNMNDEGELIACELQKSRLALLAENFTRLGLRCAKTRNLDATEAFPEFNEAFDLVYLDAPCTGLGDLASKPDIKYHFANVDTSEIESLQAALLAAAEAYVKPGGRLVYSTCTLRSAENEKQIQRFLNMPEGQSFTACTDRIVNLQEITDCVIIDKTSAVLLPLAGRRDGFFFSILEKQ